LVIGSRVRSWLQDPYKILSSLGLSRGHVFLDIGCGTGFLTFPASTVVGDKGLYTLWMSMNGIWRRLGVRPLGMG
jgi:SAM-dependent methyltransferase